MTEMYVRFMNLVKREEGQGLVEYALIIFLVAIAASGAMILMKDQINAIFGQITASLGG